jgi:hypothetical protein
LGCGEQLIGGGVHAYQSGGHVVLIELYRNPTRLIVHLGCGAVIEDGDRAVSLAADVVLKGEPGAGTHLEVALLATEAPDDLAALAVGLVISTCVADGEEQVVVVVHLNGVDMERVEVTPVVRLIVVLFGVDVAKTVPLEKHLSGLDVDLLGNSLHHEVLFKAT